MSRSPGRARGQRPDLAPHALAGTVIAYNRRMLPDRVPCVLVAAALLVLAACTSPLQEHVDAAGSAAGAAGSVAGQGGAAGTSSAAGGPGGGGAPGRAGAGGIAGVDYTRRY